MLRIFGRFIPFAAAALAVVVANQRQRRRAVGATLARRGPYTWEQLRMRDFWEVIVINFTEEPWI